MAGRSLENCPNRKVEGSIPLPSATLVKQINFNHGGFFKLYSDGIVTMQDGGGKTIAVAMLPEEQRAISKALTSQADIGAGG